MNQRDELDRTLEAWFAGDAPTSAPRHVLEAVVAETERHAPRPSWLVSLRGDSMDPPAMVLGRPARPLILLALLGALIVGLIGGAMLAGGGRRLATTVDATPTTQPTHRPEPGPTVFLSGGVLPLVDVPAGLDPGTTAYSWELHVVALLKENVRELGWEVDAPKVRAIHLLAPGSTYETTWVDGLDHGGAGFTARALSWAVDAEGTLLSCGSRCAAFGAGTFFFDDATEALVAVGSWPGTSTTPIPSRAYRDIVEGVGRAFRPLPFGNGPFDQAAVIDKMQASGLITAGQAVDPVYGTVICTDTNPRCQGWGAVEAGQSETIWWVGLPEISLPPGSPYGSGPAWDTFDALTGEELLRAIP